MNVTTLKFKRQGAGSYIAASGNYTVTIEKQWGNWLGEVRDEHGNLMFEDNYYTYANAKTFLDSTVQGFNKQ